MNNLKIKVDYKGKYFVIQDHLFEMDYEIGKIKDEEITDEFLKEHVETCRYYGIPAYIGDDMELKKRIGKFNELYNECKMSPECECEECKKETEDFIRVNN